MKLKGVSLGVFFLASSLLTGQSKPVYLGPILEESVITQDVVRNQLDHYLMKRVPQLPEGLDAKAWEAEASRIRRHLLEKVVFRGWPKDWVSSPPRFEEMGTVPSGVGYRMTKLRYEIVPGFYSTAILYAPENPEGKIPAVLNVNGHGQPGKALEYKQKRCINFAKNGILALNLEWIYFGELRHEENSHWYGGHLDLVGANAIGLFYLAMRRGLDFLFQHPLVDPEKLGVTGLSGGGWQTIILSALDKRVTVSVPVAGYSSLVSRIERPGDIGDIEQNATDMLIGQDFPHFTAMRAPSPTLLIYNNDDDCCFRAPLVKPYIFDAVRPFFQLMGAGGAFQWYENLDPGDHNYQLDNRIQAYRFFTQHFGLPLVEEEIPVDGEIKGPEELDVGIPKGNLTILGLAKKLAVDLKRTEKRGDPARRELRELIRYREVDLEHPWAINNSKKAGIESETYRFEFSDQLSATGVWLKSMTSGRSAPVTIILNDAGKKASSADVSERVNRGEQVLAIDLLFRGDTSPPNPAGYTQLLATTGDRSLGIQVSHLRALIEWILSRSGNTQVRIETSGIRSQLTAQLASALYPNLCSKLVISDGMESLAYLLEAPIPYDQAPDLFCLDLYARFDIDSLAKLADPAILEFKNFEEVETE